MKFRIVVNKLATLSQLAPSVKVVNAKFLLLFILVNGVRLYRGIYKSFAVITDAPHIVEVVVLELAAQIGASSRAIVFTKLCVVQSPHNVSVSTCIRSFAVGCVEVIAIFHYIVSMKLSKL